EDQRVDGTTAHADNVRSRNGLPMARSRRMDRAQPKACQKIKNAFSHSLGPREQGGRANRSLEGVRRALSRVMATTQAQMSAVTGRPIPCGGKTAALESNLPVPERGRKATRPGEGRFTQPTAAAQAWRPELIFMPHLGHSPTPAELAQL